MAEVQLWIEPVSGLSEIALASLFVILCSGVYLTIQISSFGLAWLKVAIASFVLMVPPGVVTGRRMGAIRRACATAKTINSDLIGRLRDPLLKISLGIRIADFLGILLLMTAEPKLWDSIGIVGASLVLGLLSSLLDWRSSGSLSAPSVDSGH